MKYSLCLSEEAGMFSLPRKLAEKLADAGENDIKILLLIYSHAAERDCTEIEDGEIAEICQREGYQKEDIDSSLGFWRGAGLLSGTKSGKSIAKPSPKEPTVENTVLFEPDKKPSYSGGELAEAVNGKPDFRALVEFTQKRLGKMINQSELSILFSLYDYLKMPVDVIMLAVEHCASEGKGSIRYVEKLLISFADEGIDNYEKAESYINRRREYKSFEGRIRTLCGFGERALTKREKAILSGLSDKNTPMELIELAYEKTVSATGKASLAYMDKILVGWAENGITTAAEAEEIAPAGKNDTEKSYDLEDFFRAAVSRGRKADDNIKKD